MILTTDELLEFAQVVRNLTGRRLTQTDCYAELEALAKKYDPAKGTAPELADMPFMIGGTGLPPVNFRGVK